MAARGSHQTDVPGLDDKREVTIVLVGISDGRLIPLQVIYARKTGRCHPHINTPPALSVTFGKRLVYLGNDVGAHQKVLAPFMIDQRQELDLRDDEPGLLLWDVFKARRCKSVRSSPSTTSRWSRVNVMPLE